MTNKEDSDWKDSGRGYMMRSTKIKKFKPFNLEEALKDTWCISMPDGNGNVTNYGVIGLMVKW